MWSRWLGKFCEHLGSCLSYPFIEEVQKPEYIYVIEDGLIDALEEYDRDNLIDISYYGSGKKYIAEMEAEFDEWKQRDNEFENF